MPDRTPTTAEALAAVAAHANECVEAYNASADGECSFEELNTQHDLLALRGSRLLTDTLPTLRALVEQPRKVRNRKYGKHRYAQLEKVARYIDDERHVYNGPRHRRKQQALADLAKVSDALDDDKDHIESLIGELERSTEALNRADEVLAEPPRAVFSEEVERLTTENVKLRNWINRVCDVVRADETWREVNAADAILDAAGGECVAGEERAPASGGPVSGDATSNPPPSTPAPPEAGVDTESLGRDASWVLTCGERLAEFQKAKGAHRRINAAAAELDALRTRERALRDALEPFTVCKYEGSSRALPCGSCVACKLRAALDASEESEDG